MAASSFHAAMPLKKTHFIKPSDIQRTAALIFSKPPLFSLGAFIPTSNGFYLLQFVSNRLVEAVI